MYIQTHIYFNIYIRADTSAKTHKPAKDIYPAECDKNHRNIY